LIQRKGGARGPKKTPNEGDAGRQILLGLEVPWVVDTLSFKRGKAGSDGGGEEGFKNTSMWGDNTKEKGSWTEESEGKYE